jgi:hypothetical protein
MATKRKDSLSGPDGNTLWIIVIGMAVIICLSWCFGQELIRVLISP